MAVAGFQVQKKQCSTCIYRPDSGFDIERLEDEIADPDSSPAIDFATTPKPRAATLSFGFIGTTSQPVRSHNGPNLVREVEHNRRI